MDAKTLLQKEGLVNEILEKLTRIEPKLKQIKKGILAGGSVANVIMSLIDNKEYPINDIDIFIDTYNEVKILKKEINLQNQYKIGKERKTGEVLSEMGAYREIQAFNIDGYVIEETYTKDKINVIKIYISKDKLSKKNQSRNNHNCI